jgi:TPR repeat protein
MRRVTAVLAASLSFALCFWGSANAAPLNLDDVVEDESPEQLCERVAADPFEGFGPEEWSHPFTRVDFYRALPACTEALKAHPDEQRFALGVALANVAGKKQDAAKPLLEDLIAKGNTSAMLVLAYISPESEAATLMKQAADAGNPNAMMLWGMTLITGKGVPKDTLEGVRLMRQAAEAGSTRAMLILANFYNQGVYGVGLNPREATSLITEAAEKGDPAAKNVLANLQAAGEGGGTPQ